MRLPCHLPFCAIFSALCLGTALSPRPLYAQSAPPNVLADGQSPPGTVRAYATAQHLYALGLAEKDTALLLSAARLAASVSLQQRSELTPKTTGKSHPAEIPPPASPATAQQMFTAAKDFAGKDDLLLSLIDRAERENTQGRLGIVTQRSATLAAGSADLWELPFYGSAPTELAIIGNGASNLDITVSDAANTVICLELSTADLMQCDFTPAENGYFYVTIENKGDGTNSYLLLTN